MSLKESLKVRHFDSHEAFRLAYGAEAYTQFGGMIERTKYFIKNEVAVSADEAHLLELLWDYFELEDQHDCGLPVPKPKFEIALAKMRETASRILADNEGERPSYE